MITFVMKAVEALTLISGKVSQEILLRNEYLAAENEILRSRLGKRVALTRSERVRLAKLGKKLGKRAVPRQNESRTDFRELPNRALSRNPSNFECCSACEVSRVETDDSARGTAVRSPLQGAPKQGRSDRRESRPEVAAGRLQVETPKTKAHQHRSALLDRPLASLARLAARPSHRATRNRRSLAQARLQGLLAVEVQNLQGGATTY